MYTEWVATKEIRPLFSSSILPSGSGTDHTLDLMDYLLNCLTTHVRGVVNMGVVMMEREGALGVVMIKQWE